MTDPTEFAGRRVLLVEDEAMIAMLLEDMLSDLGCQVIGPAYAIEAALELAREHDRIDAAILDVNLAGQPVYDVADALRARNVPVVYSTGYGAGGIRASDHDAPVLGKPFRVEDLATVLRQVLTN
jgi:CheY-like chemotaxis protein